MTEEEIIAQLMSMPSEEVTDTVIPDQTPIADIEGVQDGNDCQEAA